METEVRAIVREIRALREVMNTGFDLVSLLDRDIKETKTILEALDRLSSRYSSQKIQLSSLECLREHIHTTTCSKCGEIADLQGRLKALTGQQLDWRYQHWSEKS